METPEDHADRTAPSYRERREARKEGTDGVMAAGCNGSWDDVPLQGLEQVAEHVHAEALARHQLAQESNLAQAALDTLKAWRWQSGK